MSCSIKNFSKDVVIINELGLHARAAARIAEIVQNAKLNVWIIRDDDKADAASVIDLLTLGCSKDSTVTVKIDYPSDIDTLNRIVELIENGFGE
ncbi:MAG: HPr family phosphocarrier protein [Deltaproteobacteria bacterium]|nr:MAG: HPr family phosphocarrier protein [Deltaproteobacteria bacterium]